MTDKLHEQIQALVDAQFSIDPDDLQAILDNHAAEPPKPESVTPDCVAEAKALVERLDGFTPDPWWTDGKYHADEYGIAIIAARTDCGPLPGNPTRGMVAWASELLPENIARCEADAALIAAAPDMHRTIGDLLAVIEKQREALRYYADKANWSINPNWELIDASEDDLSEDELAELGLICAIEADGGAKARTALGEKP